MSRIGRTKARELRRMSPAWRLGPSQARTISSQVIPAPKAIHAPLTAAPGFGFILALRWLWCGFGVALVWLEGGFGVALGWLCTPEYMPSRGLCGGFGWLCPAFRYRMLGVVRYSVRPSTVPACGSSPE